MSINRKERVADQPFWRAMRWIVWGGAATLLSVPLIAMQFTLEVNWTAFDFVVMGAMLGAVCLAFELAIRTARNTYYMLGAGLAAGTAFLITWSNLAVGIVGNENNPVNLIFFGIVAIALVGAMVSRLQPSGMARAMGIACIAQAATVVLALVKGGPVVAVILGVFTAMWLLSALLFGKAAQANPAAAHVA